MPDSVYRNLALITHLFPGSGITVHTVWETPLDFWRIYVNECESWRENKQKAGGGRGR